jgi:hypothetical protein
VQIFALLWRDLKTLGVRDHVVDELAVLFRKSMLLALQELRDLKVARLLPYPLRFTKNIFERDQNATDVLGRILEQLLHITLAPAGFRLKEIARLVQKLVGDINPG